MSRGLSLDWWVGLCELYYLGMLSYHAATKRTRGCLPGSYITQMLLLTVRLMTSPHDIGGFTF